MTEQQWLADRFEEYRPRLRAVAWRMLGSSSEADDAVQEAWLRLSRADADAIDNLGGWLTTVTGRVCLNMLRARRTHREDSLDLPGPESLVDHAAGSDPEQEAVLADSVGMALVVVLDTLTPAERLAFVLHDMFGVPFDEIATIVDRSPEAARQLASRARRRVRGASPVEDVDPVARREVVDAFLAAAREGDFARLVAVLDPDVELRADFGDGNVKLVRGAELVASQAEVWSRANLSVQRALLNGIDGFLVLRGDDPFAAATFSIAGRRITRMTFIADQQQIRELDVVVLDDVTI
jgi:RNA polymerase sigma-70 factor (ECF subfamily)